MPPSVTAKPVPDMCIRLPLPLGHMASSITPRFIPARAAKASAPTHNTSHLARRPKTIDIMADFNISMNDMAMIYLSPDPFGLAFEEELDLRKVDLTAHRTAGLCFFEKDGRLYLASMAPSTPGARIPRWRTRIRGAWLIQINATPVTTISDAQAVFLQLSRDGASSCTLLFSHPEVTPDISNKGLPIMSSSDFSQFTHDQLNNRIDLMEDGLRIKRKRSYHIEDSGNVLNYTTRVMKLTRGKLLSRADWDDWQNSELLQ